MNNKFPDQSGQINVLRSADFLEIDFLKNIFQYNTFRMTICSIVDY